MAIRDTKSFAKAVVLAGQLAMKPNPLSTQP